MESSIELVGRVYTGRLGVISFFAEAQSTELCRATARVGYLCHVIRKAWFKQISAVFRCGVTDSAHFLPMCKPAELIVCRVRWRIALNPETLVSVEALHYAG